MNHNTYVYAPNIIFEFINLIILFIHKLIQDFVFTKTVHATTKLKSTYDDYKLCNYFVFKSKIKANRVLL